MLEPAPRPVSVWIQNHRSRRWQIRRTIEVAGAEQAARANQCDAVHAIAGPDGARHDAYRPWNQVWHRQEATDGRYMIAHASTALKPGLQRGELLWQQLLVAGSGGEISAVHGAHTMARVLHG